MTEWIKTNFKGVRYRLHPSRKHGVTADKYYTITYKWNSKTITEAIGWGSEGIKPTDAYNILCELKRNQKNGTGPCTLKEKRELEAERKESKKTNLAIQQRENMSFGEYFEKKYYPIARTSKKWNTFSHEETHFRKWIEPVIGKKPLKEISSFDIERIKKKLLDAGKAPRTIQSILATFRQVWNLARRDGLVAIDSPTKSVKLQKFDNRRRRYFSHAEADLLLNALKVRDKTLHDITLLALHTGMRASEIWRLTWGCVDTDKFLINIMDTKSGKGRAAFMTAEVRVMFKGMTRGKNDARVFLRKEGIPYTEVPMLFRDVVKELGFNDDVSDSRQRICFHSLRHSMASWHAAAGTDLYVIKALLGHSTITLTERYAHLAPEALRKATETLEASIRTAREPSPVIPLAVVEEK
jgi:integrase